MYLILNTEVKYKMKKKLISIISVILCFSLLLTGSAIGTSAVSIQEETSFVPETAEDDLSISRVKSFYFKPMTREEAVLQMNLLGHNFFAFRDEDNGGSFAVVYRRNEGGYGLIDDTE